MRQHSVFLPAALFLASVLLCSVANSQTDKKFPTDDEIKSVMTQTERALSDYTASVTLQEKLEGTTADVANDKRVLNALNGMSKVFGAQPQKFNSAFGFEFVLLLDDASRNAALCNADAMQNGIKVTVAGNTSAARDYLQLAQECTGVTNLLYTISENAGALYQRYVNGEESLATEAFDTMNKCVATLKQKK